MRAAITNRDMFTMIKDTIQRRLVTTFFTLLSAFAFSISFSSAHATTIKWIGCGISKLGFMPDVAKAYEKKTGIKIELEGGGWLPADRVLRAAGKDDPHRLGCPGRHHPQR